MTWIRGAGLAAAKAHRGRLRHSPPAHWIASCSCGWTSAEQVVCATSPSVSERCRALWDEHVVEAVPELPDYESDHPPVQEGTPVQARHTRPPHRVGIPDFAFLTAMGGGLGSVVGLLVGSMLPFLPWPVSMIAGVLIMGVVLTVVVAVAEARQWW